MIIVHVNTHAYKSPYLKYLTINTCKRTFRDIGCQAIYFNKIIHEKSSSRLTVRRVTRHAKYARSLTLIHLYMHIVQTGMRTHTHSLFLSLTHKLSKKHVRRDGIIDWAMKVLICHHLFFHKISRKALRRNGLIVYSCTK